MNTLETIIAEIKQHEVEHPDHGYGCACMDKHVGAIRKLIYDAGVRINDKKTWRLHRDICHVLTLASR